MVKEVECLQAVKDQDISQLQKLIQKGKSSKKIIGSSKKLNINYQDQDGMSVLHQASLSGNSTIIKLLLQAGASADIKDNKGMHPMHYAAWQGCQEPVSLLLQAGARPNAAALDGETPLHFCAHHGHYDVAMLLLHYGADPTTSNLLHKSPLDLACEFGRYKVVELFLSHCPTLLHSASRVHSADTTCVHLAARNGHADIIRLLIQFGMDVNVASSRGTCLHEAAWHGHLEVCKLLINLGIDVNVLNSYEQTALDVACKSSSGRNRKEMRKILQDASHVVQARVVLDHNARSHVELSLRVGQNLTILERRSDGIWRGFVNRPDGSVAACGWFPSAKVVVLESATDLVPDLLYASIGTDDSFPPPPSPLAVAKELHGESDRDSGISPQQTRNFVYPCDSGSRADWSHVSGDASSYRKRNSSGSASASSLSFQNLNGYSGAHVNLQSSAAAARRLSGQSLESGVSSACSTRHSLQSNGSSSSSSLEHLQDESFYVPALDISQLFARGLSDLEVMKSWLADLHFEQYFQLFVQAGYDMPTIARMTPEDLTAIGITKPIHRKRLKAEISRISLPPTLPCHEPSSVGEWLRLLNLPQYEGTLARQGYTSLEHVLNVAWEDLEEIGISRLGHQKKFMLALEKLRRARASRKSYQGSMGPLEIVASQAVSIAMARPKGSPAGENLSELRTFAPLDEESEPSLNLSNEGVGRWLEPPEERAAHSADETETLRRPAARVSPLFSSRPVATIVAKRGSYEHLPVSPQKEMGNIYATLRKSSRGSPAHSRASPARPDVSPLPTHDNTKLLESPKVKKIPPPPPKRTNSIKSDSLHCQLSTFSSPKQPLSHIQHEQSSMPPTRMDSIDPSSFEERLHGSSQLSNDAESLKQVIRQLNETNSSAEKDSSSDCLTAPGVLRLGDGTDAPDSSSDSDSASSCSTLRRHTASSASLSSTDSNTLPFANEDVGTIKQRTSSARSPSVGNSERTGKQAVAEKNPSSQHLGEDPKCSNVLNDIGCMLQTLTDELDALLVEQQ